jgi:hypothetical protein
MLMLLSATIGSSQPPARTDSAVCFTPTEARQIDQWVQDARIKAVNYSAAIVARDAQIQSLKDNGARMDSAYTDCDLRAAMLGNAHEQDRKDIAELTLKADKRGNTIKALVILSAVLLSLQILGR